MRHWAWDNKWFENSYSETVFSELFKKHMPDLFERVHQAAHIQFCENYPNRKDLDGWGVYEIFDPDEIDELARETYVEKGDD